MPLIAEAKALLRTEMRARRRVAAASVPWAPAAMPRFEAVKVLATYRPFKSEADPAFVERWLCGARQAYPRIAPDGTMDFADGGDAARWVKGPAGAAQPDARSPALAPEVILVPLLAFDRSGRRLGQGGGFYDRALAQYPAAVTIGVAWAAQEVPVVPVEPWDKALHHVVTEKEWITP